MYARPSDLAQELRKGSFDSTEQLKAERCLNAATSEIDAWLFGSAPPPDPKPWSIADQDLVKQKCVARAVEHWKAGDAAFGAIGYSDIGVMRAPRESFLRHALDIVHLKTIEGWGFA